MFPNYENDEMCFDMITNGEHCIGFIQMIFY